MGVEGFVICWDTGHRVKCKAEDYLRKHKAKDTLGREKNVIELIVTEKIDDVKAFLDPTDLIRVQAFEKEFWEGVRNTALELTKLRFRAVGAGLDKDKRTYAVEFVQKQEQKFAPFLYKMIDTNVSAIEQLKMAVAKSCGTQAKIDECRWMFNCSWNAPTVIDAD